ncbi:universal stress protein [Cellulophaga sp. Hel_I_12]|uniref:universal stress protein n=1 Tax=Cellulophaga sp. Hel_I_12 TaxID=1249972 RepID=UPI0006455362|nr:universal stress protein [Cellulophaga sp. Hel_I_12]
MKNILIPTDFSENSWNAITYGMEFFKKSKCTFYLIHVNPIKSYSGGESAVFITPEIIEETILKETTEQLHKVLKDIEHLPFNTKHSFHTMAFYGFFTDHIQKEVKDKNIDLIIMGTKGATGLKAVAIGSNTGNVIAKIKCSILAIPEHTVFKKPKEIGFPTDFKIDYNIKTLDHLKDIALIHNSTIRFLYVVLNGADFNVLQMDNKERLATNFKEIQHSFHKITGEKLETSIRCFTESRELDMVVMITKNLNFLERFFVKPTVEKISYQTTTPLLVLHKSE